MGIIVRFKPTSVIVARLGLNPDGATQQYFTKRCAEYMDNYVPYNKGDLAYTNRKIKKDKVIYDSRYAHYMYEGKVLGPNVPIKNEDGIITGWFSPIKPKYYTGKDIDYSNSIARGHTQAGPHWDSRMWSVHKDDILKETQEYMKRHGGK